MKSTKEDTSAKRDRSGSSLRKSSFAKQPVAATSSAKDYKFERVFYEAGLELKGEDKYAAYVKHSGTYSKTSSWWTPSRLCMRSTNRGGQNLLAPSRK